MPKPKRPVLSPLDRRLREWLKPGQYRSVQISFVVREGFYALGLSATGSPLTTAAKGHTPAAAIRAMLDGQRKGK